MHHVVGLPDHLLSVDRQLFVPFVLQYSEPRAPRTPKTTSSNAGKTTQKTGLTTDKTPRTKAAPAKGTNYVRTRVYFLCDRKVDSNYGQTLESPILALLFRNSQLYVQKDNHSCVLASLFHISQPICVAPRCQKYRYYGWAEERATLFCHEHKLVGMANLQRPVCTTDGCFKSADYVMKGTKKSSCGEHKTADMVKRRK